MNCKKILALLLTLVMLVTVLPMGALTVSAESTTEFLGGDGTEESPYLISNKTHLNNVRNHRSSHFKMVADIVFTEADFAEKGDYYNNGQGWQPIGTDDVTPFIGVFDGNGHIIKGLYVNILKTNKYIYAGLFGYNEGTIKNLGMLDGSVSATAPSAPSSFYAGGIAGWNYGTISNCYNTGSASASVSSFYTPSSSSSSSYAGGIAGYNREGGTISNCYYLDIIAKGVGGGTGNTVPCTLKEMTQQGTFVGFDFDTVWTMAGNEDYLYPELQNIPIQLKKELVAISVTPPTKTEYLEGKEQLDVTGGKLTLTYNNGTSEVIDLTTDMVSGFDNTKVGKQTLTVTYQGKTTTFEVEIIAVTVPFRDVDKDAYYAAAVDWAVSNEITNGTSDSTFSPDEGCTRAQVVTFLWRAAGKPAPASSTNPFSDVKPGAYYYNAVLWAVEKGITNGTSGTTFSPDETCTRAQIVTFLWRYEEQPAPAGTNNPFADVKPNAYFGSAVLWAVETGITNGTSATTFDPEDTCTRAQVVTFLYRDIVKS